MIGWHISIYQIDEAKSKGEMLATSGRIAEWQSGASGLEWIDELVKEGNAISRGGDGYPYRFIARTKYIVTALRNGPPSAIDIWKHNYDDVVLPKYEGGSSIIHDILDACNLDEWLLIEAWDES